MVLKRWPYMTIILALCTVIASLLVNYLITGTLLGKVKVPELEPFGGYTYKHILNLEIWRIFVSQFIHVKQAHMVYNVLSLLALGFLIERKLGSVEFTSIWLFAGTIGTFVSTFTVPEPWNLGTGGSQAILALSASGLVMYLKGWLKGYIAVTVLVLTIMPAFALDLLYAEHHLPKLGHVVSFSLGVIYIQAKLVRVLT